MNPMENKRKVVLYIAQSLDGYIARENNDISWLSIVERDNEDYGYNTFIKTVDTVFMGRKTYDKVLSFGIEFPHKGRTCYVLSKTLKGADENVQFFSGNIAELITKIKAEKGKDIFIDGGSEVIREFRDKDLIDEYVISIIPILLGKGIRLFKEIDTENNLKLMVSKAFDSGLVQLKYTRVKE
jgi:dihydrofolate reductase